MTTSYRGRLLIAGTFTFAALVAPTAVTLIGSDAPAVPVAECEPGMIYDPISGSCSSQPQKPMHVDAPSGSGLTEVDGIPCTGRNTGECIALNENNNNH